MEVHPADRSKTSQPGEGEMLILIFLSHIVSIAQVRASEERDIERGRAEKERELSHLAPSKG